MKTRLHNKLILGSANLNQKYGLSKNEIKIEEYKKIINFLSKKGKVFLDTASDYNGAEKIIGDFDLKNMNIITKIKINNVKKNLIEKEIFEKITNSKKIFKNNKIYAVLIHNPDCLLKHYGKIIFKCLKNLKDKKVFKKVGISIYDFESVKKITSKYNLDIIKLSYNVFDQRLNNEEILKNLKKRKIEIHARSIFLQGMLLKKKFNYIKNISLKKKLVQWNKWLKTKNLKSLDVCVSNSILNSDINKTVVGFDNYLQFKKYLKVNLKKNDISLLNTNNKKIINPNLWH